MELNLAEAGPQVIRFAKNTIGTDYAVGDIHGCFSALQVALDAIGFDPTIDRLFCPGDLVDRGPESHMVEAWLDKPWLFSSKGNHDLVAHQFGLDDPDALHDLTNYGGEWFMALPKEDQVRIGRRLLGLPLAMEVQTAAGPVGILHADFPTDDWRSIDKPFSADDESICLWSTMRFDRMYDKNVQNVRALIHGHLTLSVAQQIANVHFIDTGGWMVGEGHFTFLELETLKPIRGPGPNARFKPKRYR